MSSLFLGAGMGLSVMGLLIGVVFMDYFYKQSALKCFLMLFSPAVLCFLVGVVLMVINWR